MAASSASTAGSASRQWCPHGASLSQGAAKWCGRAALGVRRPPGARNAVGVQQGSKNAVLGRCPPRLWRISKQTGSGVLTVFSARRQIRPPVRGPGEHRAGITFLFKSVMELRAPLASAAGRSGRSSSSQPRPRPDGPAGLGSTAACWMAVDSRERCLVSSVISRMFHVASDCYNGLRLVSPGSDRAGAAGHGRAVPLSRRLWDESGNADQAFAGVRRGSGRLAGHGGRRRRRDCGRRRGQVAIGGSSSPPVNVWITTANGQQKLSQQAPVAFSASPPANVTRDG